MPPKAAGLIMSRKIHGKFPRQARKIFNKVKLAAHAQIKNHREKRSCF
jgi:hypothetical protein